MVVPWRRSRLDDVLEHSVTVIGSICCLPCICVYLAYVGGTRAKKVFIRAWKDEQPKRRRAPGGEERKTELIRRTPKRVPPRLERHLTIGRPEPEEKEEEIDLDDKREVGAANLSRTVTITDGQETSGFFRLPWEIRRKIYEEAFGGYVIHIVFMEGCRRMSHTKCKSDPSPAEGCHGFSCKMCGNIPCRKIFKAPGAAEELGNVSLLSRLQSCRRM